MIKKLFRKFVIRFLLRSYEKEIGSTYDHDLSRKLDAITYLWEMENGTS